jgi:hypothetical protein
MNRYYISDNRYKDGSISKSDRLIACSAVDFGQFIIISVVDGFPFLGGKRVWRILYLKEVAAALQRLLKLQLNITPLRLLEKLRA